MNLARSTGLYMCNAMNLNRYNTRPSKFRGPYGFEPRLECVGLSVVSTKKLENKDETAREIKFPDLDDAT